MQPSIDIDCVTSSSWIFEIAFHTLELKFDCISIRWIWKYHCSHTWGPFKHNSPFMFGPSSLPVFTSTTCNPPNKTLIIMYKTRNGDVGLDLNTKYLRSGLPSRLCWVLLGQLFRWESACNSQWRLWVVLRSIPNLWKENSLKLFNMNCRSRDSQCKGNVVLGLWNLTILNLSAIVWYSAERKQIYSNKPHLELLQLPISALKRSQHLLVSGLLQWILNRVMTNRTCPAKDF